MPKLLSVRTGMAVMPVTAAKHLSQPINPVAVWVHGPSASTTALIARFHACGRWRAARWRRGRADARAPARDSDGMRRAPRCRREPPYTGSFCRLWRFSRASACRPSAPRRRAAETNPRGDAVCGAPTTVGKFPCGGRRRRRVETDRARNVTNRCHVNVLPLEVTADPPSRKIRRTVMFGQRPVTRTESDGPGERRVHASAMRELVSIFGTQIGTHKKVVHLRPGHVPRRPVVNTSATGPASGCHNQSLASWVTLRNMARGWFGDSPGHARASAQRQVVKDAARREETTRRDRLARISEVTKGRAVTTVSSSTPPAGGGSKRRSRR
jgi:hypothetical protein